MADADDPTTDLSRGDEDTAFTFRLPAGTACPGDSMHDNWRVQTFMVPADADVGKLSYGVIGPDGASQYALFGADDNARSYVNLLTQANGVAGQPGLIGALPRFDFVVVAGQALPSGNYRIGYACTYFGATATYWDAEIVVTAGSGGLSWHLVGAPPAPSEPERRTTVWVVFIAGSIAAAALAWLVLQRRGRSSTPRSKESK
ncbi:MAG: hypothetical protein WCC60_20930 [Ilumatobacteraceae bacterium]